MNPTALADPTHFDVRDIPCRVKHAQIIQRWHDLPVGRHFVLINDHDPVPLYYQFEAFFPGAFTWEYLLAGPEEFHVKITRQSPTAAPAAPVPSCGHAAPPATSAGGDLDLRGLPPPEPMQRILERVERTPPGGILRARTDRQPLHLFAELLARGARPESEPQPDGSWLTTIHCR